MAEALFLCWLLSFWHCTIILVGMWVIRMAESVVLTCCPPARITSYNVCYTKLLRTSGAASVSRGAACRSPTGAGAVAPHRPGAPRACTSTVAAVRRFSKTGPYLRGGTVYILVRDILPLVTLYTRRQNVVIRGAASGGGNRYEE